MRDIKNGINLKNQNKTKTPFIPKRILSRYLPDRFATSIGTQDYFHRTSTKYNSAYFVLVFLSTLIEFLRLKLSGIEALYLIAITIMLLLYIKDIEIEELWEKFNSRPL